MLFLRFSRHSRQSCLSRSFVVELSVWRIPRAQSENGVCIIFQIYLPLFNFPCITGKVQI